MKFKIPCKKGTSQHYELKEKDVFPLQKYNEFNTRMFFLVDLKQNTKKDPFKNTMSSTREYFSRLIQNEIRTRNLERVPNAIQNTRISTREYFSKKTPSKIQ